jgi:cytochrome c biogenesis protein CcdA
MEINDSIQQFALIFTSVFLIVGIIFAISGLVKLADDKKLALVRLVLGVAAFLYGLVILSVFKNSAEIKAERVITEEYAGAEIDKEVSTFTTPDGECHSYKVYSDGYVKVDNSIVYKGHDVAANEVKDNQ